MSTKINESSKNDELNSDNGNSNENNLSIKHEELVELTNKTLKQILAAHPDLKDIPVDEHLNDELLAKVLIFFFFWYFIHASVKMFFILIRLQF